MSTIKSIVKNAISLYSSQFINSILAIFLSILIARNLGDMQFGKYSFALAITAIFATFADLGYDIFMIREVSKDKLKTYSYLSNITGIRIVMSFIIFGIIVIFVNFTDIQTDVKKLIYLFGGYILLISFANLFRTVFRAFEKMEYITLTSSIANVIRVILGALALFSGYGLSGLGFVFLFSGFFDLLLCVMLCRKKFVKIGIKLNLDFLKNTIKIAIPLGMANIFGLIYSRVDIIMLSFIDGDAVVGWYTAAYTLTANFQTIPNLFMNALLPIMAVSSVSKKKLVGSIYKKSFRYLFILGLPLTVGISLLSDKIILFFYGNQFSNSIIALQILAWGILLIFLHRCLFYSLIVINKQIQITKVAGICVLINVGLNIILIPLFSYIGAGIATILTQLILFGALFYISSKNICIIPLHKIMLKPVIVSFMMGILILILKQMNFVIIIMISILFYFTILYLIGGITKDDKRMLKNIFRRGA